MGGRRKGYARVISALGKLNAGRTKRADLLTDLNRKINPESPIVSIIPIGVFTLIESATELIVRLWPFSAGAEVYQLSAESPMPGLCPGVTPT